MGQKILLYTGILIGTYLALAHATQGGQLLAAGSNAYQGAVKVLQGR
jgi:hypothetical protein